MKFIEANLQGGSLECHGFWFAQIKFIHGGDSLKKILKVLGLLR